MWRGAKQRSAFVEGDYGKLYLLNYGCGIVCFIIYFICLFRHPEVGKRTKGIQIRTKRYNETFAKQQSGWIDIFSISMKVEMIPAIIGRWTNECMKLRTMRSTAYATALVGKLELMSRSIPEGTNWNNYESRISETFAGFYEFSWIWIWILCKVLWKEYRIKC